MTSEQERQHARECFDALELALIPLTCPGRVMSHAECHLQDARVLLAEWLEEPLDAVKEDRPW